MTSRVLKGACATAVVAAAFGGAAQAAGPPPPTATNGHTVELVGAGLSTPTSFAFGEGQTFVSDFGTEDGKTPGGVFVLKNGAATKLPGSPPVAFGLAFRRGTLYVSAGNQILTMSNWDGSKFATIKVLYKAPARFTGFNGIAFGANGRLYAGVSLNSNNDHSPEHSPFAFSVVSMTAAGKNIKTVARGLRQPWQLAFPTGSSAPFVSNLGQDLPKGIKAPDYLVRVRPGQNYGFPACNWVRARACRGFAKPFKLFAPHTDVGGVAVIGRTVYISEFGFNAPHNPPLVQSIGVNGGRVRTVLKNFVAPIIGLGAHGGWLYVGSVTGQVFRVKP